MEFVDWMIKGINVWTLHLSNFIRNCQTKCLRNLESQQREIPPEPCTCHRSPVNPVTGKKWGRDVYRIHFRVMAQREGMCIWHMWNIYDRFGSMRNQLFNKTFSGPASLACLAVRLVGGLERKSWKVFPKVYLKVINKWGRWCGGWWCLGMDFFRDANAEFHFIPQ